MATLIGKDYLTHEIAQELLDQIIGYLDLSNCLKLRIVFSNDAFKDRIAPTIRPYLTNLFVSPTETSLFNFERIAKSPFFNGYVDTVTFVPQALCKERDGFHDGKIEKFSTVADYRNRIRGFHKKIELSGLEATRSLELYRSLAAEHKIHYQSWNGQSSDDYPEDVYKALKEGLSSLPKLKRVMISSHIAQDGLNASCLLYSDSYEEQREASNLYNLRYNPVRMVAKGILQNQVLYECTPALFAGIGDAKVQLRSLEIGSSHEDQMHETIQESVSWNVKNVLPVFRKLNKLTVSCEDTYIGFALQHRGLWKGIASSAIGLSELTLFTGANFGHWKGGLDSSEVQVLGHFLKFGNYPSLRIIRIRGVYKKPDIIANAEFVRFLNKHHETLEEVDLSGVLFSDRSMQEDVCATIRCVLDDAAAALSKLKSFKMLVHRRDKDSNGERHRRSSTCKKYMIHPDVWMHRSQLDNLASSLGVALRDGSWDFGGYVMRTKI
ncbi:hypothetical protein AC578_5022 [Pseudocercospora eumusae]|uniref:Uncharacterized protein n=1 Tax=Pseudocercospora eumusae TaxID=321146 RepID=A0A139H641_9PEZI|nr:hypothetical protein AC578_5022 [Pseudocercospora eumusae]